MTFVCERCASNDHAHCQATTGERTHKTWCDCQHRTDKRVKHNVTS